MRFITENSVFFQRQGTTRHPENTICEGTDFQQEL